MQIAPPTPAEKLTQFSLRLSQAVEDDAAGWWLPAPLIAMIAAFIKEIAETLAELAALLRDGKLPLHQAAPPQSSRRPARKPKIPATRSPRPKQAMPAVAPVQFPLADQAMAEPPAAPSEPEQRTRRSPRITRAARLAPQPRPIPTASVCGPPIQFSAFPKHLPWHAQLVTI